MEGTPFVANFISIAEISIAFIGFAALVDVFQRKTDEERTPFPAAAYLAAVVWLLFSGSICFLVIIKMLGNQVLRGVDHRITEFFEEVNEHAGTFARRAVGVIGTDAILNVLYRACLKDHREHKND